MKRAAITGVRGYVGSVIDRELIRSGWLTTGLARVPDSKTVRWSLGESAPVGALDGVDALVHCAWDFDVHGRDSIWRRNVDGTRILLESARAAGVERILVVSSMSAY